MENFPLLVRCAALQRALCGRGVREAISPVNTRTKKVRTILLTKGNTRCRNALLLMRLVAGNGINCLLVQSGANYCGDL